MLDARAKWTNEEVKGPRSVVSDPFPASSKQELYPTLPGIVPSSPAPYSAPYSSRRATAETQEYSQPVPPVEPGTSPGALADNERTDWCVDFGAVLTTMDTFELWAAIDRGDVNSAMRVWREGMECWTPIKQLPELAVALTTASSRTPEPITLQMPPKAPAFPILLPAPMPAPQLDEVRPPMNTLISGPRTSGWERLSQRILPAPSRGRARTQAWVALGSAMAATAITAALISTASPRASISPDARAASAAAPIEALVEPAAITTASPALPEPAVTAAAAVVVEAPLLLPPTVGDEPAANERAPGASEPRPHHDDRGQHRLRRSGKRGSGG
jgi:hypothetical protein